MFSKLYKILLILGIVFVLISIPVFLWAYDSPENLEVDFLDVGQGDAILIKAPAGQNILIDGASVPRFLWSVYGHPFSKRLLSVIPFFTSIK